MSHFAVFVSACINSFISARTHCRSVTLRLNNRPELLVPLSCALPNEPHWWCIYCIICKIYVWCTLLKLLQSGGTEFMSTNILSKLLFKHCRAWSAHITFTIRGRLRDVCFASSRSSPDFSAVLNVLTLVRRMRKEDTQMKKNVHGPEINKKLSEILKWDTEVSERAPRELAIFDSASQRRLNSQISFPSCAFGLQN